ncbi:Uncharacterised protein [Vibrio cholerae]|nr:Uncharacterised protein [Vibrio cholerae]
MSGPALITCSLPSMFLPYGKYSLLIPIPLLP